MSWHAAVEGNWRDAAKTKIIPDPLNGEPATFIPDTDVNEIKPFVESLKSVPKHGLHNPIKNPGRCVHCV